MGEPEQPGGRITVVGRNREGWSDELVREFAEHEFDGHVGSGLLFENQRVRVWEIRLAPGERWHVHRHVLDYFWTAVTGGRSRQHNDQGETWEVEYDQGDTLFLAYAEGEFMVHDIENIGTTSLEFVTVELKESANSPLPVGPPRQA